MTNKSIDVSSQLERINGLAESLLIPEKTRSLLWITEKTSPQSDIQWFDPLSGEAIYQDGAAPNDDLYAEPSLIWTKLAVVPNDAELPKKPFYSPTYRGLSPQERFQYLNWLRDTTQPTYLSYVFLYLYGLERHLLIGDYDSAVDEIKILLKHHDIGAYAYNDLAVASIVRNRSILDRIPDIESLLFEPALLRAHNKISITPTIILGYASQAGFTNNRYIKLHPDLFNEELQKTINDLEKKLGGAFFSKFQFTNYQKAYMINVSLKHYSENIKIPEVRHDDNFKKIIFSLLDKAHKNVRFRLHPNITVIKRSSRDNSAEISRLNHMISQLVSLREKSSYASDDSWTKLPRRILNKYENKERKVWELSKDDPVKSNKIAFELFDSGYRTPDLYRNIAKNYRNQREYKLEVEFLLQMKRDFSYNHLDSRLRALLRLLEKNEELLQGEIDGKSQHAD